MERAQTLTAFQTETETALRAALVSMGSGLDDRKLEGRDETYIRARLRGTAVEVFIYDDEAGLQGPGVDIRFEAPDYEDSGALRRAFVVRTVSYAKERAAGS